MCDEWLRISSIAYTTGLSMYGTWGPVSSVGIVGISLTCRLRNSGRLLQFGPHQLLEVEKLPTIPEGNPKN